MTGALLPIPGSGRVISYKIKYNSYNTEAVKKKEADKEKTY